MDDVIAGSLTPYLKSQEPFKNVGGDIVHVVGTNFEELVLDESKDVFLMYYAPWCGHCSSFRPTWTDLGREYRDTDDLVIAMYDQTANEAEKGWPVTSFPTLVYYGKDNKGGEAYQGARELDALTTYIQDKRIRARTEEFAKEDL